MLKKTLNKLTYLISLLNKYNLANALVLTFIAAHLFIFINQAHTLNGFVSDFTPHVKFSVNPSEGGYSLMHTVVRFITNAFVMLNSSLSDTYYILASNILVVLLVVSVFISYQIIYKYFSSHDNQLSNDRAKYIALSVLLISMLVIDFRINSIHYLGSLTPNPIHNPTYLFSKPFALITFIIYSLLIEKTLSKGRASAGLLLVASFVSALCMWAKPSFLISFIPTFIFFTSFLFFKNKKNWFGLLINCLTLIPSAIPLLLIKAKVFSSSEDGGQIVISFGEAWSRFSGNIFISIVLATALPLFMITIFLFKSNLINRFIKPQHKLSVLNFLFAVGIYLAFQETGPRSNHANFGWTYSFSLLMLFLMTIDLLLIKRCFKTIPKVEKAALILLSLHILSGLYYFILILFGYSYK